jgi:tRNA nucleotidyltransferase/poly(A) polymerase
MKTLDDNTFLFAEVGGAVRDRFLNIHSKDVDFTSIPNVHFDSVDVALNTLRQYLEERGFDIKVVTKRFFTFTAEVPKDHPLRERTKVADFVLARKDGPYSDNRHPDYVLPGNLHDDLSRRDFTVNAIAILNDEIIDPFGGKSDLENRILRFVGNPAQRIKEDGLRVMRALRFSITRDLVIDPQTFAAINSAYAVESLSNISKDRIVTEMEKMFKHSTIDSLHLINGLNISLKEVIFSNGLWLRPTLRKT